MANRNIVVNEIIDDDQLEAVQGGCGFLASWCAPRSSSGSGLHSGWHCGSTSGGSGSGGSGSGGSTSGGSGSGGTIFGGCLSSKVGVSRPGACLPVPKFCW